MSCRTPAHAFPTPTEEEGQCRNWTPSTTRLSASSGRKPKRTRPSAHPLAAMSRRAALTGGAAALVSTAIAACGGDGNKPAIEQGAERHVRQRHLQERGQPEVRARQPRDDEPVLRADQLRRRGRLQAAGLQRTSSPVPRTRTSTRWSTHSTPRSPAAPTGSACCLVDKKAFNAPDRRGAEGQDPGRRLQRGRGEQRAAGLHRPGPVRLRRGDGQADPGSRPVRRRRAVHRHARVSPTSSRGSTAR